MKHAVFFMFFALTPLVLTGCLVTTPESADSRDDEPPVNEPPANGLPVIEPPDNVTKGTEVSAAEGGVVVSGDVLATLTIPAGALEADREISITRIAETELPLDLLASDEELVEPYYRLEPDGLEFLRPIRIAVRQPDLSAPSGPDSTIPIRTLISYSSAHGIESAGSPAEDGELTQMIRTDDEENGVVLEGALTHFSIVAGSEGHLDFTVNPGIPSQLEVGEEWTTELFIRNNRGR